MAVNGTQTHVVRRFQVDTSPGDVGGTLGDVLDVGACLSKLNHRLYRQGRSYRLKVNLDTRTLTTPNASVGIYSLMPTWYVHSAWRMAKKAYDDALADEKAILSEGNLARWRDFRVDSGYFSLDSSSGTLNPIQYQPGTSPSATIEMSPTEFSAGEFNFSTVENLDTGVSMKFVWPSIFHDSATQFDMMSEFTDSRNESEDPQTIITDMPYHELMSDANDDDYIELQANGSEPPYNRTNFPSHIWVKVGSLQSNDGAGNGWVQSTGFFDAPCGLVIVETNEIPSTQLHIEVAKGDYRGVHAPAM